MNKFWKAIDDFLGPGINRFPRIEDNFYKSPNTGKQVSLPPIIRQRVIELELRDDDIVVLACGKPISDDHLAKLSADLNRVLKSAGRQGLIIDDGVDLRIIHRDLPRDQEADK